MLIFELMMLFHDLALSGVTQTQPAQRVILEAWRCGVVITISLIMTISGMKKSLKEKIFLRVFIGRKSGLKFTSYLFFKLM